MTAPWPPADFVAGRVRVGDWETGYLEGGPFDGPVALLLHGFPDAPSTWRHLAPALVARGWRVVVPWLPHHGPTRAVGGGSSVHPVGLAAWVAGLRTALAREGKAVVVGHDWGAVAANEVTSSRPELFDRAVTLAVSPILPAKDVAGDLTQTRRSLYAVGLSVPGTWRALRPGGWRAVERLWTAWSPGHRPDDVDRAGWSEAMAHDGGRGAAGYYRALVPGLVAARWPTPEHQHPKVETLHLAGENDGCYGVDVQRRGAENNPPGSRFEVLDGVGHFLHLERPDDVNQRVVDWLEPVLRAGR